MELDWNFRKCLKKHGYDEETVKEIWKWYNYKEKTGVASF
jgi:hypothetical protein